MLILFGTRTTVRQLAMLLMVCGRCGHTAAHGLRRRVTKFTLFFVPLFPIRSKYFTQCSACGVAVEQTKERAEALQATAAQQAAQAAPTVPAPTAPEQQTATPAVPAAPVSPEAPAAPATPDLGKA